MGTKLVPWKPSTTTLSGKREEVFNLVIQRIKDDPEAIIYFKDIMIETNISDRSNFRRDIKNHPALMAAFAREGIVEYAPNVRPTAYTKSRFGLI